jgi:hypothetical protein
MRRIVCAQGSKSLKFSVIQTSAQGELEDLQPQENYKELATTGELTATGK